MHIELQSLAEIVGPYGIQHIGERLMEQVSAQVKEIRKLVEQNQDTLLALHTNRDKPDIFTDLFKKLRSKNIHINIMINLYVHITYVHVLLCVFMYSETF